MPLVIVNDRLVVKLSRSDPKTIVGIRRSEKESVILEERPDQPVVRRRRFPKHGVFRVRVETACQLR